MAVGPEFGPASDGLAGQATAANKATAMVRSRASGRRKRRVLDVAGIRYPPSLEPIALELA